MFACHYIEAVDKTLIFDLASAGKTGFFFCSGASHTAISASSSVAEEKGEAARQQAAHCAFTFTFSWVHRPPRRPS